MRLSTREQIGILRAVSKALPDAQVYLYGSRVNDNLRGGDIDLLILISDPPSLENQSTTMALDFFHTKMQLAVALEHRSSSQEFVVGLKIGDRGRKKLTQPQRQWLLRRLWELVGNDASFGTAPASGIRPHVFLGSLSTEQ